MKPFLLLSSRGEDLAADDEYVAFLRETGLSPKHLVRVRMEQGPLPRIDLDDFAGVLVGGGPFNSSDPPEKKSPGQVRVEREISALLDEIVARDFPFMGACYGVGTLGVHQGGVIDRKYAEPVGSTTITLTDEGRTDPVLDEIVARDFPFMGACYGVGTLGVHQGGVIDRTYAEPVGHTTITLTDEGRTDPLLEGVPQVFEAYVGHKEACSVLPPTATLLAASPDCPVQMFRVKKNLYATQFHPELDRAGIITRVRVYQHYGYFPPEEMEELIARLDSTEVTVPPRILANFAARYG